MEILAGPDKARSPEYNSGVLIQPSYPRIVYQLSVPPGSLKLLLLPALPGLTFIVGKESVRGKERPCRAWTTWFMFSTVWDWHSAGLFVFKGLLPPTILLDTPSSSFAYFSSPRFPL